MKTSRVLLINAFFPSLTTLEEDSEKPFGVITTHSTPAQSAQLVFSVVHKSHDNTHTHAN